MKTGAVASGAPLWVYALLLVLIVLGVRRLRTREMPLVAALIAPAAFLIWSVAGAVALANRAGVGMAALAWLGGIAVGVFSNMLLSEPRGIRLSNGRVQLPGSRLPLALYMMVFLARFACGAWAALRPADSMLATATGVGIGAVMTARLVMAVFRWQPVDQAPLAA
jgi:hypothetical protein